MNFPTNFTLPPTSGDGIKDRIISFGDRILCNQLVALHQHHKKVDSSSVVGTAHTIVSTPPEVITHPSEPQGIRALRLYP